MRYGAKHVRFAVVILSLLVFLLALNAKLSSYDIPPRVNGPSSSKLWLNGQKMEAQAPSLLVVAVLSLCLLLFRAVPERSRWPRAQFQTGTCTALEVLHLHRFLRPPPTV